MRAVIQRVSKASVDVNGKTVGSIDEGLVILLAVGHDDTEKTVDWMLNKTIGLRIFNDENGKMNLSLEDVGGSLLVISQFTLYGNCEKGKRPSFVDSAPPEKAESLYECFLDRCRQKGIKTESGIFGAMMMVHIDNDGPVTFVLER